LNGRRTFAITKKVLRSLKHDPRSIALMLVAPILAMGIFGFAFGSDIANVPVAIVDEDAGPLAARIVANLDGGALALREVDEFTAARAALEAAEVRAIIFFPDDFSASVQQQDATVTVLLDGSNSQYVAHVQRHLQLALQETIQEGGSRLPVTVEPSFVYAEGARYIDFFVPGIMAFAAMMFTTLLTLLAFVNERTSGTLTRLLATPVRGAEIVLGYALAFGIVAALQGAILLAVALWIFDVMLVGSLALAFLVVILVAIDAMSLGILLSAAAKRELQAVQMIPLVVFPTFLLSGIFVAVESLPAWLRPFSWAIPPTYAVEALRDIMLRGWGIAEVWPYIAALVGFGALFLTIAAVSLERQRA
jgi:ABC-2 type transport system permease protein